jgi:heme-degrading monooxygenase HmoA
MQEQRFAVLTFWGSRNQQALFAREEQLRAALKARDINPEKSARAFFYDPPWKLP